MRVGLGQLVGQVTGPVGAVVVHDQEIRAGHRGAQAARDGFQILPLLVGRHDDGDALNR